MKTTFLLILGMLGLPLLSLAQTDFNEHCSQSDLVYLNDSLSVEVDGKALHNITFYVKRSFEVKINTEEGIQQFRKIRIPESFDKTHIGHANAIRNVDNALDYARKLRFSVMKKKDETSDYSKTNTKLNMLYEGSYDDKDLFSFYDIYEYEVKDIEVGDRVKIEYNYYSLYHENPFPFMSQRFFFHDEFPKHNTYLSITFPEGIIIDTAFNNGATPRISEDKKHFQMEWSFDNLYGCLNEPGSHPYHDLPNVVVSLKPPELMAYHYKSFDDDFFPLWLIMSARDVNELNRAYINKSTGYNSKNMLAYEKIGAAIQAKIGVDSNGLGHLRYMQQYLNEEVNYEKAVDYFMGRESHFKQRPGWYLSQGRMKDPHCNDVYANLIAQLGMYTIPAYISDKRSGMMSPDYFYPIAEKEKAYFVVLKDTGATYVLPKGDGCTYQCDELPFYYENTTTFLVSTGDFPAYRRSFNTTYRLSRTPMSHARHNSRKTFGTISVNLDSKECTFQTKQSLSGQYSTLCRHSYRKEAVDSTVNPKYWQRIYDVIPNATLKAEKLSPTKMVFPFLTSVSLEYSASGLVAQEEQGYSVDIAKLFSFITDDQINSETRYTDYYADFTGTDLYSYQLQFDKPVELEGGSLNQVVDNDFGRFELKIQQTDADKIMVTSVFITKQEHLKKEDFAQLYSILQAIKQLEKQKIRLKPGNV